MDIKLVGFVKQHDNIEGADDFLELQSSDYSEFSSARKAVLISYLSTSEILFAWMDYFSDIKTGAIIAPHGYRSDGEWIWPSYLPYYIGKYNLWEHYKDFLQSIEIGKIRASLSSSQIEKLTSFLKTKI